MKKLLLIPVVIAFAGLSTSAFAGQRGPSLSPLPMGSFTKNITIKAIANSTVIQCGNATKGGAVTQIGLVNQNSPLSLGGL